jgi:hypothetical protein
LIQSYPNFRTAAMNRLSPLLSVAAIAFGFSPAAFAASTTIWEGRWAGILKTGDAVSVTIAGGKVVGYTIRGAEPFGIAYCRITSTTVAFGDRQNYSVKLFMRNERTAFGTAHSPMGDGYASLTKQ